MISLSERILFLGCGSWGATLAYILSNKGHAISIWHHKDTVSELMDRTRKHYLMPSLSFPDNVKFTNDVSNEIKNTSLIIIAIPSQSIRKLLIKYKDLFLNDHLIVNLSKGIELDTLMTVSDIILDILGDDFYNIVTLSGPSHAEEVLDGYPTTLVSASKKIKAAKIIQKLFHTDIIRTYVSTDIKGVELGGAIKNVIAIASGIIDGIGYGDNTKAALLTRGLFEISKLGKAMGAKAETFSGLSGMGDLFVTCYSKHSRNRFVGEQIGKGKKINDILSKMSMIAEGISTTKAVYKLSEKYKIDMPIIKSVYQILLDNKDPNTAIKELMNRELNLEHYI